VSVIFQAWYFPFVAPVECNRTQRDDSHGLKVNKLDEGVGDTFELFRGKYHPDFASQPGTEAQ